MTNQSQIDFIILGAGVTGLAAGSELKKSAVILEKEKRPGGLVKTHCFNDGYWFDHVLHILHFKDEEIQNKMQFLLGNDLKPCPPVAWIECKEGTALYPFQLNLGALNEKARNQCIADYAKVCFSEHDQKEKLNYREFLEYSFGKAMCDVFYFPYNEKQYKYPLEKIVTDAILWNLHRPSFEEILEGGFNPNKERVTYNTNAFYPCPPINSPVRGMEVLSQALASGVNDLQLEAEVTYIDTTNHTVHFLQYGITKKISYQSGCLSTIPLPKLMRLCTNVPLNLLRKVDRLEYTKVLSIAIAIKGQRPVNTGHWRYYTDPDLPFTRLIFTTTFDTNNAPSDGWGLLAEITWPGNEIININKLVEKTINGITKLGYLHDQQIIGTHTWIVDPAYVIFTAETNSIITECFTFLDQYNITAAGRYGKWEYSSMYQNIKEGFSWAKKVTKKIPA